MLIRYPGSKDQHLRFLLDRMQGVSCLAEPFAGTAAVSFGLLASDNPPSHIWLNDIDVGMVQLWITVRDHPEDLIDLVERYVPSAQDFYDFKENPGQGRLQRAFRKVVLHQISYSGLGAKAGSPIGGRNQTGKYKVDCRWNPDRLIKKITRCHELMQRADEVFVTNWSWETMLDQIDSSVYFTYLDPPYFRAGSGLYVEGDINHGLLSLALQFRDNWLLSYDNVPEVQELYRWAKVEPADVRSHLHHKEITDVVITPVPEPILDTGDFLLKMANGMKLDEVFEIYERQLVRQGWKRPS